jgi:hypothetical protein
MRVILRHSRENPSTAGLAWRREKHSNRRCHRKFPASSRAERWLAFRRDNSNTSLSLGLDDEVNATRSSCIAETVVAQRRMVREGRCANIKNGGQPQSTMTDLLHIFPIWATVLSITTSPVFKVVFGSIKMT